LHTAASIQVCTPAGSKDSGRWVVGRRYPMGKTKKCKTENSLDNYSTYNEVYE